MVVRRLLMLRDVVVMETQMASVVIVAVKVAVDE